MSRDGVPSFLHLGVEDGGCKRDTPTTPCTDLGLGFEFAEGQTTALHGFGYCTFGDVMARANLGIVIEVIAIRFSFLPWDAKNQLTWRCLQRFLGSR